MPEILSNQAEEILRSRYYIKDSRGNVKENWPKLCERVAKSICCEYTPWETIRDAMCNLDFVLNTPALMNMGRPELLQQGAACFVTPIHPLDHANDFGDASIESILDCNKWNGVIHKTGGGTGTCFSFIRPRGDSVRGVAGAASGVVSFLRIFNATTEEIKQGRTRRGANMATLHIWHPDIIEFINCKRIEKAISNFNISVLISDSFMKAVAENTPWELKFNKNNPLDIKNGKVYDTINARELWEKILYSSWKNGEPGILFEDNINRNQPMRDVQITATNPCGEVPLDSFEACVLGSINLKNHVVMETFGRGTVDWPKLHNTTRLITRALNGVIDASEYPLPQIAEKVRKTRKIGLGVMGYHDALIMCGKRYDSDGGVTLGERIIRYIKESAKLETENLAMKFGNFPAWEDSYFRESGVPAFNSTLMSIAPTGTISRIAGASFGIEPIYMPVYYSNILDRKFLDIHPLFKDVLLKEGMLNPDLISKISEEGLQNVKKLPNYIRELFKSALDIRPEWHLKHLVVAQKHVCNAVSKTINLPYEATVDDIRYIYNEAHRSGVKGVTIYRDNSRELQVLGNCSSSNNSNSSELEVCPNCGEVNTITRQGGCAECLACSWSLCSL